MPTHIYLSPHVDDISFSLSATIAKAPGGNLINIFSRSDFVARPMSYLYLNKTKIDNVSEIRNREDEEWANRLSLKRENLDLTDATGSGLKPLDLSDLSKEIKLVESRLVSLLKDMTKNSQESIIFCPMAIGGHRNHLSTLIAILNNYKEISANKACVAFYEDLPYAANAQGRLIGIDLFSKISRAKKLTRYVHNLSNDEYQRKIDLVNIYLSQHCNGANNADFIPSDSKSPSPHEAFWMFER